MIPESFCHFEKCQLLKNLKFEETVDFDDDDHRSNFLQGTIFSLFFKFPLDFFSGKKPPGIFILVFFGCF